MDGDGGISRGRGGGTGCGVDCEHAAAASASAVGHVPHVVRSRFAFRCCDCDMIIDTISVELAKALLNSNMAGANGRMVHGSQLPGLAPAPAYHLPAYTLRSLRSLLNFAFSMSSMSSVLTFDSASCLLPVACWPGRCNNKENGNWRAMPRSESAV